MFCRKTISMLDELKIALTELLEERRLSAEIMKSAVGAIMDGRCTEAEIAAFLTALRCRGDERCQQTCTWSEQA